MNHREIDELDYPKLGHAVGRLIFGKEPTREWRIVTADGGMAWPRAYPKCTRAEVEAEASLVGGSATEIECAMQYDSDVDAAMDVVEELTQCDFHLRRRNEIWMAEFTVPSHEFESWAESAAVAICRAALKLFLHRNPSATVSPV